MNVPTPHPHYCFRVLYLHPPTTMLLRDVNGSVSSTTSFVPLHLLAFIFIFLQNNF